MRNAPTLLYGESEEVSDWVSRHIPEVNNGFKEATAIGVISEGKLIAGVVYNEWQPEYKTIQLNIAATNPMWARKEVISGLLAYPFYQVDVFKCWLTIPSDNKRSLKMTDHVGFTKEGVMAHQFGKKRHAVIKRMFKPDYERMWRKNK
jgi:RimJ/RimL family protein N-acetyltransferase|tara:strand:- start:134 stop:577 length:444 start_codon:yes stop_codon:yes gene_type:complete